MVVPEVQPAKVGAVTEERLGKRNKTIPLQIQALHRDSNSMG